MIDADARTLVRLDTETGAVETTATGATPVDVAIGAGGVWVANGTPRRSEFALGPIVDRVVRLDAATQRQDAEVSLPPTGDLADTNGVDNQLAVMGDAVWVVNADGSIVRLDGPAADVTASPRSIRAFAIAAGRAGVWALAADGSVVPLNPRTARAGRRVRIPGGVDGLAVGDTAAWATSWGEGKLWRIVPGAGSVPGSVEVGSGATDVATTRRAAWVANPGAGTVTQVDPVAMRVVRVIEVGGTPRSLATDGRTVWAAATAPGPRPRAARPASARSPRRSASPSSPATAARRICCSPPICRCSAMHDSRRRRWRRRSSSCCASAASAPAGSASPTNRATTRCPPPASSTSIVRQQWPRVCRQPGCRRRPRVVQLGLRVRAAPRAQPREGRTGADVSAINSYVGLTREADEPGLLGELYPTGKRSFARIFPADDLQGAALAEFARRRGRSRAFILEDPGRATPTRRGRVRDGRGARGLEIAGRVRWDPRRDSYAALARRVNASGADAVLVSGLVVNNGGRLVRDLRTRLGRRVDILAPDGFAAADLFDAAGAAALGVHVTYRGRHRPPSAGGRPLPRALRPLAARRRGGPERRVRGADGRDAARRDRPLRRHAGVGAGTAHPHARRGGARRRDRLRRARRHPQGVETIVRIVGGKRGTGILSLSGAVVEDVIPVTPAMVE